MDLDVIHDYAIDNSKILFGQMEDSPHLTTHSGHLGVLASFSKMLLTLIFMDKHLVWSPTLIMKFNTDNYVPSLQYLDLSVHPLELNL